MGTISTPQMAGVQEARSQGGASGHREGGDGGSAPQMLGLPSSFWEKMGPPHRPWEPAQRPPCLGASPALSPSASCRVEVSRVPGSSEEDPCLPAWEILSPLMPGRPLEGGLLRGTPAPPQGRWGTAFPSTSQQVPWATRPCGAVGRQVFTPDLAGKVSGLGVRWGKGEMGCPLM